MWLSWDAGTLHGDQTLGHWGHTTGLSERYRGHTTSHSRKALSPPFFPQNRYDRHFFSRKFCPTLGNGGHTTYLVKTPPPKPQQTVERMATGDTPQGSPGHSPAVKTAYGDTPRRSNFKPQGTHHGRQQGLAQPTVFPSELLGRSVFSAL